MILALHSVIVVIVSTIQMDLSFVTGDELQCFTEDLTAVGNLLQLDMQDKHHHFSFL